MTLAVTGAALPYRQPSDTFSVVDHGIDRVDFAFRNPIGDLNGIASGGQAMGKRRTVTKESTVFSCGLRFDYGNAMAWVDVNSDMISVPTLRFAEYIATGLTELQGVVHHDSPTIRRLDLATDVYFADPVEARAVLDALTAVTPARHRLTVEHASGSALVETVFWSTGDGIKLRVYDKTREFQATGVGRVLRFEHQARPRFRDQRTVSNVLTDDLSKIVTKPLKLGTAGGLLVADLAGMHAHLVVLRDQGVVSQNVAERLLGSLVWAREGGPESWTDSRTSRLRRRELEDLGVAFHPQLVTPYDLGPVLRAVQDAWATASR